MKPSGTTGERSTTSAREQGGAYEEGEQKLLERVLERSNLARALKRVEQHRGAAGVDRMGVEELRPYLVEHWPTIRERLLEGTYEPRPVRRVEIPKPDGGKRLLGIPTVLDRFIQQAILQALTPLFEPGFSNHSYGFRPGRKVNEAKSAVDRPWKRRFLGFSFLTGKEAKIRIAPKSLERLKGKLRELTRRNRSQEMRERIERINGYVGGWVGYFAKAETPSILRDLDSWLLRRLRACVWKTWKRVRTRYHKLRGLGLPEEVVGYMANTRKGPWRIAGSPPLQQGLNRVYWKELGLVSLLERYHQIRNTWRTAGCGPARPVV